MGEVLDISVLDDLILGNGVKRGRHEVPPELAGLFCRRLAALGFVPLTVSEVEIEVGTRVPAWLLRPPLADFGTVFWEVFTQRFKRKLFGSEVRNRKGDWEIQLYPTSKDVLYANPTLAEQYDASRPIGMY